MTSPIIPWMGGKRRLADRIFPLFPQHYDFIACINDRCITKR